MLAAVLFANLLPLLLLFFHAHVPSWVQGSALSDWPPNSHLSSSTCFYCRCAPCTAVQHSKSPSSFLHHCPESRERFSPSLSLSLSCCCTFLINHIHGCFAGDQLGCSSDMVHKQASLALSLTRSTYCYSRLVYCSTWLPLYLLPPRAFHPRSFHCLPHLLMVGLMYHCYFCNGQHTAAVLHYSTSAAA